MTYTYNSMQWYYYAYAFFLRTQMCFDVLILIFSSLVHITRAPSLSPVSPSEKETNFAMSNNDVCI